MNSPLQAPRMRAAVRRVKAGGERFLGGVLPGATARRLQTAAFADEWSADNLDARQATGPLWVVLGDSASQGIGATTRESGYVGVMHELLRRRDAWRVINLSKAGAGVLDVLARQLPELVALANVDEPALVTCLIGAEDMARRTPGLDTALRQVISSLPTGSVIGLLPHGPRTAGALNSVIREEAERHAMRIAVLPPRLPGMRIGRDGRFLDDVGHAAWARAVLAAADGPVAVAAPATDPRLPVVPPLDTSPPTDPRLPVVPALDTSPKTDPRLPVVPDAAAAGDTDADTATDDAAATDRIHEAAETDRMTAAELAAAAPAVAEAERQLDEQEPAADGEEPAAEVDEPVVQVDEPAAEAAEPDLDEAVAKADEADARADEPVAEIDEPADGTVDEPVRAEVDAPAEPVVEEAVVVEEPVVEEPAVEGPAAEEPGVDEPVVAEVVAAEPMVEETVVEEPVVEEPVAEAPAVEEPAVDEAVADVAVAEVADPAVEAPPAEPAPFGGFGGDAPASRPGAEAVSEPTVEERTFTAPSWYPSPNPRPFGSDGPATTTDRDEPRAGAEVERVESAAPERRNPAPDAEVDLFAPALPRPAEADELRGDEGGNGRPHGADHQGHQGHSSNGHLNGRAERADR
ncbi:SGNH/GDSL hydrolase family protein [Pseudonocardia lacus]|uniref:SGNH/GDSL hydrolase family protein n=1 Tax=Pseudonocardia lacus TaxID=2835865 RepID=UPI001BDBEA64|nr:SGNH/GDSL hydrolase family protein [Pseudonocardia lacus]